jgi:hypothetical protein
MGWGAYIPEFIKIGSDIQNLFEGDTNTCTLEQQGDLKSLLLILQNKESRLQTDLKYMYTTPLCNISGFFCLFVKQK